jgi:hypothetical protein
VIVHRFGSLDAKQEHHDYAVIGPRLPQFNRCRSDSKYLRNAGRVAIRVVDPSLESGVGARGGPCRRHQDSLRILRFLL